MRVFKFELLKESVLVIISSSAVRAMHVNYFDVKESTVDSQPAHFPSACASYRTPIVESELLVVRMCFRSHGSGGASDEVKRSTIPRIEFPITRHSSSPGSYYSATYRLFGTIVFFFTAGSRHTTTALEHSGEFHLTWGTDDVVGRSCSGEQTFWLAEVHQLFHVSRQPKILPNYNPIFSKVAHSTAGTMRR